MIPSTGPVKDILNYESRTLLILIRTPILAKTGTFGYVNFPNVLTSLRVVVTSTLARNAAV